MSGSTPIFDQRGQRVTYQYNSAGNINISGVSNRNDFLIQLDSLQSEIGKAADAKIIDQEQLTDLRYNLEKTQNQANKAEPNKSSIKAYLEKSKEVIQSVGAAAGLVEAISQLTDKLDKIF